MKVLIKSLIFSILLILASCQHKLSFVSEPPLDHLQSSKIDISKFFNGQLEGFAIIRDNSGNIISKEIINVDARWDQNKGKINWEYLKDGKRDTRTWLITLNTDGTFDAFGHDAVVPGVGRQVGNASQMLYILMEKDGITKSEVKFSDKTYLVDENSAIVISKFGSKFGDKKEKIISLIKVKFAEEKDEIEEVKEDENDEINVEAAKKIKEIKEIEEKSNVKNVTSFSKTSQKKSQQESPKSKYSFSK
jgi:hypothetical protein